MLARVLPLVAVALFASAIVHAEQSLLPAPPPAVTPPPTTQVERQISNYGDHDKSCNRWTDQCRACSRGDDGAPNCSNIGIACQPAAVECTARQDAVDKK